MADSTAAWNKAFTQGSSALQKRLKQVHAKNPQFQAWLKSSGHGAGESVKQASKEVKASSRVKTLRAKSLKAYGATKGAKVGGEYGSEDMKDTIKPLTRDQHSKVQAAERAAKAAAKTAAPKREPIKSKEDRLNFLKRAFTKAKSPTRQARFDVSTLEKNREHDDLRDVHDALHISGIGSKYSTDESVDRMAAIKMAALKNKMNKPVALTKKPQTLRKAISTHKHFAFIDDLDYAQKDRKSTSKGASNRFEEVEQMNEVSKSEAEKVLGGPVKEKPKMPPGKQPEGYRYVRSLARKAMKAGMKKEEFEQVEEASDLEKLGKKYAVADKKEKEKESAGYTGKYPGGKEQKEKDKDAFLKRFAKEEVVLEFADEPKHSADAGEYDYEGDMAKSQLRSILANAKRLHDMLKPDSNLPEWVQSKITLAEDYILTAANYMEGEMNEEFTDEKLSQIDEKAMSDAQMKKREKYVKSMKPVSDWEKRYPGRGEQVMYATATKMAMKEEAEVVEETTEEVEQIEEKYMGFKALKASIAAKGGVRDPAAVAAAIGRKKYGKEKFQAMAAAGKRAANEEVEQVEEGYVVKYHDAKGEHKNTSKVFDDKASAAAKAEKGNSVDKVGGKYTVHKISEKGSEMKEALDPVGKENKDVDNDGDSDKTDSYLLNRRNAVRNAIRSKLAKKLGK